MQSQSPEQRRISEIEAEINKCGPATKKSAEVQRLARALNIGVSEGPQLVLVMEAHPMSAVVLDLIMGSLEGLKSFDERPIQAFWCMDYYNKLTTFHAYMDLHPDLAPFLTEEAALPNSTIVLAVSNSSGVNLSDLAAHIEAVKIDIGPNRKAEKVTFIVNSPQPGPTIDKIKEDTIEYNQTVIFKFLYDLACKLDIDANTPHEIVMPCRMFTSYKCGQTTLINIFQHVLGGNCEINLAKNTEKEVAGYYLDLAEILLAGQKVYQDIYKIIPQLEANKQAEVKEEVEEKFQQIKEQYEALIGNLTQKDTTAISGLRLCVREAAERENLDYIEEVPEGGMRVKPGTKYGKLFAALKELEVKAEGCLSIREAREIITKNPRDYPVENAAIIDLQNKVRSAGERYRACCQSIASSSSAQRPGAAGPARATTLPAATRSAASTPTNAGQGQQPGQASPNLATPAPEADIKAHIEHIGGQQKLSEATIKFAQQISQDKRLTDFEGHKTGEVKTEACLLHIAEGLNELGTIKEENIKFINYSIDCSLSDITPEFVFNDMMPQEGKEFFQQAMPGSKLCMFYTSALNSYDPNNAEHRAAGVAHTIAVVFRINEQKKIEITYCEAPRDTAITLEERQVRERERLPMFLDSAFYQKARDTYGFVEIDYSKTRTAQPYQFGINMGCAHSTVICGLMNALGDNFLADKSQRTNAEEAKHFLDIATLELGTEAQKEALVEYYMEMARGEKIVIGDISPDLEEFIRTTLTTQEIKKNLSQNTATQIPVAVNNSTALNQVTGLNIPPYTPSSVSTSTNKPQLQGGFSPADPSSSGVDRSQSGQNSGLRRAGASSSGVRPKGYTGTGEAKLDISAGATWRQFIAYIRGHLRSIRECGTNEDTRKKNLLTSVRDFLKMDFLDDEQTLTLALQAVAVYDFEETLKLLRRSNEGEGYISNYGDLEEGLKKYYSDLPGNLNDKLKEIYKKLKKYSETIIAAEINGEVSIKVQVENVVKQVILGKTPELIGNSSAYRIYPLLDDCNFIPSAPPLSDVNLDLLEPTQPGSSALTERCNAPLDILPTAYWRKNISSILDNSYSYFQAANDQKGTYIDKLKENLGTTGSDKYIIALAIQALNVNKFEETVRIRRRGAAHSEDNVLSEGLKKYYPGEWALPSEELTRIYDNLCNNKQPIIEAELRGTKTIQQHIEVLVRGAQERIERPVKNPSSSQVVIPTEPIASISSSNTRNKVPQIKGPEKLKSHEHKTCRGNPKVWIHSTSLALAIGCGITGAYLLTTDKNPGLSPKKLVDIGLIVLATVMGLVAVTGLIVNKINNIKSPNNEMENIRVDRENGTQR